MARRAWNATNGSWLTKHAACAKACSVTLCCAPSSFTRFALGPTPSNFSHHFAVPEAHVVDSGPCGKQAVFMCVPHGCMATLLSLPADVHLLPVPLTMKDLPQMLLVLLNLLLLQTSPYLSLCLCSRLLQPWVCCCTAGNNKRGFTCPMCTLLLQRK